MIGNLCAMHREACEEHADREALRFHDGHGWCWLSWWQYRQRADAGARGCVAFDVQPGDRVALLSENRWEWLVADHALLSAGAVTVPLHAPLSANQVRYQLGHSGARGIVVSGQEQAEKVFAVREELPDLEWVVTFDPVDPHGEMPVTHWDGLCAAGDEAARDEVFRRESKIDEATLATILYTSGTTGDPKGVMLTHGNLCSNAAATLAASADIGTDDVLLSWLPYSHVYARTVDHYLTSLAGSVVCLARSHDTLLDDLSENQPTWMTSVPRFYEKVWSSIAAEPEPDRPRRLRELFGPRVRQLFSGGAPLPPHVCRGFFDCDVPLYEGYGLTESSPVISFNGRQGTRIGSVGRPVPGVDVRIAGDAEILTRGPHVMEGYWKNPEATAETIRDGWLYTGDLGELDEDGFLSITGRKKDLIVTSQGKNVVPAEIERLLVGDHYVDQAIVFGDERPYVVAILVPNFEALGEKSEELGCEWDVEDGFVRNPALLAFLQGRVETLMEQVSQPERVRRFLVLAEPLSVEADELTPTLKVRRAHVLQKYGAELDALYDEAG